MAGFIFPFTLFFSEGYSVFLTHPQISKLQKFLPLYQAGSMFSSYSDRNNRAAATKANWEVTPATINDEDKISWLKSSCDGAFAQRELSKAVWVKRRRTDLWKVFFGVKRTLGRAKTRGKGKYKAERWICFKQETPEKGQVFLPCQRDLAHFSTVSSCGLVGVKANDPGVLILFVQFIFQSVQASQGPLAWELSMEWNNMVVLKKMGCQQKRLKKK